MKLLCIAALFGAFATGIFFAMDALFSAIDPGGPRYYWTVMLYCSLGYWVGFRDADNARLRSRTSAPPLS